MNNWCNILVDFLQTRAFCVVLSFALLFVGGMIYIIFRSESLLMFTCLNKVGALEAIQSLRKLGAEYAVSDWIKYSLPDGLWLFSYMFLIDTIWGGKISLSYYFFLWVQPTIAVVSEVLQVFGWLPGVFDILDLVCYVGAVVVFLILKFFLK